MTHVRANTLVFTVLLSVAMAAQPRIALAETAGHLARVFGDVRVDETRANTGDTFESGATISTGSRAFSVLKFTDGQVVALRAGSVLSVDDYLYAENDLPDSRSHTSLLDGGMRALTGIIGNENPEAVSFNTPVATIGIRGTEMVIGLQTAAQGTAAEAAEQFINLAKCFDLFVQVQQDEVEVKSLRDMSVLEELPKVSRCEDLTEEDLRALIEQVRQAPPSDSIVSLVSQGESFGFVDGQKLTREAAEAFINSNDPLEGLEVDMEAFQAAQDTTTVGFESLPPEIVEEFVAEIAALIAALEESNEDPSPVSPVSPVTNPANASGAGGSPPLDSGETSYSNPN